MKSTGFIWIRENITFRIKFVKIKGFGCVSIILRLRKFMQNQIFGQFCAEAGLYSEYMLPSINVKGAIICIELYIFIMHVLHISKD